MTSESPLEHQRKTGVSGTPDLLPNFCDNQVLLVVLLAAEALAIVLTLSQASTLSNIWASLGNTSFFILIIALIDTAILCFSNQHFLRWSALTRSLALYLVLQIVTLLVTMIAYLVLNSLDSRGFSDYNLQQAIVRNISISIIITGVILRYFYVRHQNKLRQKSEELARIQALQARIRPHFLFNSLNTIANLIHQNPDQAEEAILDLAELFRSTLTKSTHITVSEEVDIVKRYLKIEQLRLGERLQVEWDISENTFGIPLPALLIQPLVENAIYHGIEPLVAGGTMQISIQKKAGDLVIKISNPIHSDSNPRRTSGNQIAIDNIEQRLALSYLGSASLKIEKDASHFCVTISLPANDTNYAYSDSR